MNVRKIGEILFDDQLEVGYIENIDNHIKSSFAVGCTKCNKFGEINIEIKKRYLLFGRLEATIKCPYCGYQEILKRNK